MMHSMKHSRTMPAMVRAALLGFTLALALGPLFPARADTGDGGNNPQIVIPPPPQPPTYQLFVGSAFGNVSGEGTYAQGATAAWSVSPTEVSLREGVRCVARAPYSGSLVMYSDQWLYVGWDLEFQVTCTCANGDWVTPASAWVKDGEEHCLDVSPPEGYRFAGWSGDVPEDKQYDVPLCITADAPLQVEAHFVKKMTSDLCWLHIFSSHGDVVGAGHYQPGQVAHWYVSSPVVEGAPGQRFLADPPSGSVRMDDDYTITVEWTTQWSLIAAAVNGITTAENGWYDDGSEVVIAATGIANSRFLSWTGDVPVGHETDNPLTVTMNQARSLTAHFATAYNRLTVDDNVVVDWQSCNTIRDGGWHSDVSLVGAESGIPATFDGVELSSGGDGVVDAFETGTVGEAPPAWMSHENQGGIRVTDSPVHDGSRALLVSSTTGQEQGVYRPSTFRAAPSSLSLWVYLPTGQAPSQLATAFWYGGRCVTLRTAADDTLAVYLGGDIADGSGAPAISGVAAGVWHQLALDLFCSGEDTVGGDADGDGLSDADEVYGHGTQPLDNDTDDDGLSDGWEVVNGTDPLGNDAPVIAEGESVSVTIDENGTPVAFSLTLHASDVTPNDDATLAWSVSAEADHGEASVLQGGIGPSIPIGYTPAAHYIGQDSFVVQVADGRGGTDTIRVDVVIHRAQVVTTDEDTPAGFSLLGQGDQNLSYVTVVGPAHGAASQDTAPGKLPSDFVYTPSNNYHGTDRYTYRAIDGAQVAYVGSVTIIVRPVNDAPVISQGESVTVTMDEGASPVPWGAPAVVASDVEGDLLTWSLASEPGHGTATVSGTGISPAQLVYGPAPDWNGADSFDVQVSDGHGGTDTITVNVTVRPVNDPPTALPLTVATPGNTACGIVLAARDIDSTLLTFSLPDSQQAALLPKHGQISLDGANCTYTPAPNFAGTDSFSYRVSDGAAISAFAPVTVVVGMAEPVYLLEFNEQWLGNSALGAAFANSGFSGSGDYSLENGVDTVRFAYNDHGGTVLHFDPTAPHCTDAGDPGVFVAGPILTYGKKFVMEVGLRARPLGPIDLVVDEANGLRTLHWSLDVDGKMHVALDETAPGTFALSAVSSAPVLEPNVWTRLEVVVDLDALTRSEIIGMYVNGYVTGIEGAADPVTGPALALTGQQVTMLRRHAATALDVDFIRVITDLETHSPTDFYPGEVYTEEDTGTPPLYSSVSIMAPATTALRRTRFRMVELSAMSPGDISTRRNATDATSLYDTHPNTPCAFHGVFEINFALEKQAFTADEFTVDVYAQHGPDEQNLSAWKKIAEVPLSREDLSADTHPAGIHWVHRFWDSHVPVFDWTTADTAACGPAAKFNLKFEVR